MRPFLRLLKQISLFICLLFCLQTKAQEEETNNKQLSIKAAMVIPAFYDFKMSTQDPQNVSNIKPDFKLSYVVGLQYKSRHNLLIEAMFQPYNFSFKSPTEYWYGGYHGNTTYPYYGIDNYKQYRISVGIGLQKNINKKSSLGFILGAALFLGDHGDQTIYDIKLYNPNGTSYNPNIAGGPLTPNYNYYNLNPLGGPTEWKGLVDNMSKLAPYINVCYNY